MYDEGEMVRVYGEGCEILEYAPGFVRYSSFCQCFQETVGGSLDRSLSPSPPLTEHSPPLAEMINVAAQLAVKWNVAWQIS